MAMAFKTLAVSALVLAAMAPKAPPTPAAFDPWGAFKERFVSAEGRVIDTGNQAISHSEGQGAGMLLATHYGDRTAFTSLWQWTKAHLQVRQDALFAWKWTPEAGVADTNNATDGDLLIAWALSRAAERWKEPQWQAESRRITGDVLDRLVRRSNGRALLLPGAYGFESTDGLTLNLSYWVFPAFRYFQRRDSRPEWAELDVSGRALLKEARFGRWSLPTDWLLLAAPPVPAAGFKPRFGYNAVRIPLYLLWAGNPEPDLLSPFQGYWRYFRPASFLPAWTDVVENSVDSYHASPGIQAIAQATLAHPALPRRTPLAELGPDYYSATLQLFARAIGDPSW